MRDRGVAASFAEVFLAIDYHNLVDAMDKSGTTTGRMKPGQIIFGDAKVECTIRNVSSSGALLEPLSRANIPDQFVLLDVSDCRSYACNVVLRKAGFIGIVFA
jgi:hypothetical protein